jgi:hypothetical protein
MEVIIQPTEQKAAGLAAAIIARCLATGRMMKLALDQQMGLPASEKAWRRLLSRKTPSALIRTRPKRRSAPLNYRVDVGLLHQLQPIRVDIVRRSTESLHQ